MSASCYAPLPPSMLCHTCGASDLCLAPQSDCLIKLTRARSRAWNSSFPGLEVSYKVMKLLGIGQLILRIPPLPQASGTRQTRTQAPFPTSLPSPQHQPRCALHPPSPTPLHAAARVVCWALACIDCMHVLTRVPGPPIGVTRLGSPASPRIVPIDAAACRAYRDPGGETAPKS